MKCTWCHMSPQPSIDENAGDDKIGYGPWNHQRENLVRDVAYLFTIYKIQIWDSLLSRYVYTHWFTVISYVIFLFTVIFDGVFRRGNPLVNFILIFLYIFSLIILLYGLICFLRWYLAFMGRSLLSWRITSSFRYFEGTSVSFVILFLLAFLGASS